MNDNEIVKIIQKKEYEMLVQLKTILERNNIPFFLSYGTALGCVRHNGFIPWDDDVDICIYGSDYMKLKEVFRTQDTGSLRIHDFETKENYPLVFPKVVDESTTLKEKAYLHLDYECGVYIDIFLLFSVPDNRIKRVIAETLRYVRYAIVRAYYSNEKSKAVYKKIAKLFPIKKIQKKLYDTYTKDFNGQKIMNAGEYKFSIASDKETVTEFDMHVFVNEEMPIPKDYDTYLKTLYGNYMELPPESKRVSNHNFASLIIDGVKLK